MTEPVVTAIGRLLKRGGLKLRKVIAVRPDGSVRTVVIRPMLSR
jgi:hypothetical protein